MKLNLTPLQQVALEEFMLDYQLHGEFKDGWIWMDQDIYSPAECFEHAALALVALDAFCAYTTSEPVFGKKRFKRLVYDSGFESKEVDFYQFLHDLVDPMYVNDGFVARCSRLCAQRNA